MFGVVCGARHKNLFFISVTCFNTNLKRKGSVLKIEYKIVYSQIINEQS